MSKGHIMGLLEQADAVEEQRQSPSGTRQAARSTMPDIDVAEVVPGSGPVPIGSRAAAELEASVEDVVRSVDLARTPPLPPPRLPSNGAPALPNLAPAPLPNLSQLAELRDVEPKAPPRGASVRARIAVGLVAFAAVAAPAIWWLLHHR